MLQQMPISCSKFLLSSNINFLQKVYFYKPKTWLIFICFLFLLTPLFDNNQGIILFSFLFPFSAF